MIIGISGKIGSGKDTVGKIIQLLSEESDLSRWKWNNEQDILHDLNVQPADSCEWQIKKFADKLKDIVCLLIGCTREQLEDQDFKNKELGEEWRVFNVWYKPKNGDSTHIIVSNQEEVNNLLEKYTQSYDNGNELLTPRKFFQLLATECCRDIIHPNIWVNVLFREYKERFTSGIGNFHDPRPSYKSLGYPNWIITDVRFPNELQAVKDRGGISIRVNRTIIPTIEDCKNNLVEYLPTFLDGTVKSKSQFDKGVWENYVYQKGDKPYLERALTGKNMENGICGIRFKQSKHSSETALDNAEFDYTIENDGTIEELIDKVKQILEIEKII